MPDDQEQQDDESLQVFVTGETAEKQNPLQTGLDEARADVAIKFKELIVNPEILREVAYEITNAVELPNGSWLRDALVAELKKLDRAQATDQFKHIGNTLLPSTGIWNRIRKLLGWHSENKQEEYIHVYDPDILDNVRRALSFYYNDRHVRLMDSKPESANSPAFAADMQKTLRIFYLSFEAIKKRKTADDNIDVTKEELVASRVQVFACLWAISEVLRKKYIPVDNGRLYPRLFALRKEPNPIETILAEHRELKERKAKEAKEDAEILAGFNSAAGGKML